MNNKTKRSLRKRLNKQSKYLTFMKSHINGLPDDTIEALKMAREICGLPVKAPKPSHSSIMAHFDIIFKKLGVRPGKKLVVRKPARTAVIVSSNGFLQSYEWRRLRMEAIKLHGRQCQCCGAVNAMICVDHIKPRKTHPELALELDNLQILCEPCNHGKGNWDTTDWRLT